MKADERKIFIVAIIVAVGFICVGIFTADTARETASAISALIGFCVISAIMYLLIGTKYK